MCRENFGFTNCDSCNMGLDCPEETAFTLYSYVMLDFYHKEDYFKKCLI